jgi:hypothetical protein
MEAIPLFYFGEGGIALDVMGLTLIGLSGAAIKTNTLHNLAKIQHALSCGGGCKGGFMI